MANEDQTVQRVTLPPYSMWADTPIYSVDDTLVFGLLKDPIIPDSTDQVYVVTQAAERRLDAIAALFYSQPRLWWVLALVNRINDPLLGIPFGTELRIPTEQRLADEGILSA